MATNIYNNENNAQKYKSENKSDINYIFMYLRVFIF